MKFFKMYFLTLFMSHFCYSSFEEDITNAIVENDKEKVKELITLENIETKLYYNNAQVTPFYLACWLGRMFIGEYLANFNPNIHFQCQERQNCQALNEAVASEQRELVLLNLAMGAKPTLVTLQIAQQKNNAVLIRILEDALNCPMLTEDFFRNCIVGQYLNLASDIMSSLLSLENQWSFKALCTLSNLLDTEYRDSAELIKKQILATRMSQKHIFIVAKKELLKFENYQFCKIALFWIKTILKDRFLKFFNNINCENLSFKQIEIYNQLDIK